MAASRPERHLKSCLITGGAGFIGANIVERLLGRDDIAAVRVLDNLSNGRPENVDAFQADPRYAFVEGDIRSVEACRAAVAGMTHIVHLAALGSVQRSIADPIASNAVNVDGFLNMLVAARDATARPRFVYASSSSIYGDSAELPKMEGREGRLLSPYAVTKAANEHYARVFSDVYGFHSTGLRFFNVFGPRQHPDNPYAAVIPLFCRSFLEQRPPTIFGDGETSRDFTFVANAVDATLLALFHPEVHTHQVYNVATGERITLNEMVAMLRRLTGQDLPATYAPERSGDIRHSLASIDRIARDLGYRPTVPFEEGIRRTWQWIQTQADRPSAPATRR
ncbi:MAG: hypothetical protein RLZZ63_341 [Gemmatimonadota bacterium]